MGVKSKKKAKTRLDAYYRLAKDQGYRARSAFKLLQLNRKYDFLAKARVLVDLCAAPGGWCQVAAKYMPVGSKIVGVDLVPIQPIRGVKTFVGDITDDKTRKMIFTWLKKEPTDVVIHDGAPNVGGVWSRDMYDQNALVLSAAKMACSLLRHGGWFVTKVFRSPDFHKLLWVMRQLFEKVEATKPLASRMESAEIFVTCAGYLAPKQLDPDMFNPQKVFSDVGEEKIVSASGLLVTPKTSVPQGYDEFATVLHRVSNFTDFLTSKDPKLFLKTQHELRFVTEEERALLKSKASKKELVHLCGDLQQVGEADLRRMLRWREQLLREQAKLGKTLKPKTEGNDGEDEEDVDSMMGGRSSDEGGDDRGLEDEEEMRLDLDDPEATLRLARDLLEIQKRKEKEVKKKQKKVVDRKLKQIKGLINFDPHAVQEDESAFYSQQDTGRRTGDGDDEDDENEEEDPNSSAFTVSKLSLIPEGDVTKLMDRAFHHEAGDASLMKEEDQPLNPVVAVNLAAQEDWDGDDDGEDEEGDDAGEAKPERLVEGDEYMYDVDNYGNYVKGERSARVRVYEGGFSEDDDDAPVQQKGNKLDDEEDDDDEDDPKRRKEEKNQRKLDEAGKQSKWQRRHLNVDQILHDTFPTVADSANSSSARRAKKKRALEEDRITLSSDHTISSVLNSSDGRKPTERTRFQDRAADDSDDDDEDFVGGRRGGDDDTDDEMEQYEIHQGRRDSRKKRRLVEDGAELTTQEAVRQQRKDILRSNREIRQQRRQQNAGGNGKKKSSTEDRTFEEIPVALTDPSIRARTLAIAQKMLDPHSRREIMDASVNRYLFNDDDDLPDWFVKDEQRNCRVELPVTAEEVEEQRRRFMEMNARPSKKVMEAMGRKRRRAQRLLHHLVEKGKSDPRAREKSNQLSVRKLMRAQVIKGEAKKKHKYLDRMQMGRMKRDREKAKRDKHRGGGKKKR